MQAIKLLLIVVSASCVLVGCSTVRVQAQSKTLIRNRLAVISSGELKGMSKVEVIEKIGEPLAISESQVSECWYYAQPQPIWIWFKDNQVDHWDVE
ncbi:MAG: hypothetical protein JW714_00175 [Candidatus Omnitrophica bacterium]|nr:hypothetical protein [Candidatus Omnitrophota bacterium]